MEYKKALKKINEFFEKCPFLIFSISFICAVSIILFQSYLCIFIFFLSLIFYKKYPLVIIFFLLGIFIGYFNLKKIPDHYPLKGRGTFEILDIKENYSFGRYYSYKIKLKNFKTENKTYKNIKASISSKKRLNATYLYKINGEINSYNQYLFFKKPFITKDRKKAFSIFEIRYLLKKKLFLLLKRNIKDKNSYNFLHTLLTSNNHGNFIPYIFSISGLSHTLAISGFHFGILILFFSFILDKFFSKKISLIFLLIISNFYFLFVGPIVSIQRAFIMIQLFIIAKLINRKYFALNAIGLSLFLMVLINPTSLLSIGMQLSFLASFAILLMHPITNHFLSRFIKDRNKNEIESFNFLDKIVYKILIYLKSSISISLSVNFLIFPLLLYHFNKFPIMSLVYNLIVPFLIGILMLLLLTSIFLSFLPIISNILFITLNTFTNMILNMTLTFPSILQFYIRSKAISINFIILYISVISIIFIFLKIFYIDKEANDFLKIV
ncbi:MAG: hypothetical protein K1060chlam5_00640 [Candidatus Anoxychlamydiales bacterium]|nr:hypothetical protein [Candidatus Anoxychlamydiales bacterium]